MRSLTAVLLAAMSAAALSAQRPASSDDRGEMLRRIDARRDAYATVAKQIWGVAEVGYQETKSSALLQQQLRAAGFEVKAGVADIPTAFVATFGSGFPDPNVATNAVGMSATPAFTSNPAARSCCWIRGESRRRRHSHRVRCDVRIRETGDRHRRRV